jgi:hypothetical protein
MLESMNAAFERLEAPQNLLLFPSLKLRIRAAHKLKHFYPLSLQYIKKKRETDKFMQYFSR